MVDDLYPAGLTNPTHRRRTLADLKVMRVLRARVKSLFSGERDNTDIPATQAQLERGLEGERPGVAMPDLASKHAAFLVSGMTPEKHQDRFGRPTSR